MCKMFGGKMQTNVKIIVAVMILIFFILSLAKWISFSISIPIEIMLIYILDFLNNYEICCNRSQND